MKRSLPIARFSLTFGLGLSLLAAGRAFIPWVSVKPILDADN